MASGSALFFATIAVSVIARERGYGYDANGNMSNNGDVITVTDTNQSIVSSLDYGPFGTLLTHTGPYHPRYRFSSKEWDEPVALYYYGYRFYSPGLGRWLSRDPIGEGIKIKPKRNRRDTKIEYDLSRLEPNLYRFVRNSPLEFIDYLGLDGHNNCSKPICVKPENGKTPIVIQPGETYDGAVDGVSDCSGDVVKITDPYNDSDIDVGSGGVDLPGPDFINDLLGGGKLKCPPDDGWKPLFDCAKGQK